ncbi:MAG TPA: AMP-binding protein, partial [Spirochaetota bacterium]|nr:AMP-binding protein [Spirochaetota bacterium]
CSPITHCHTHRDVRPIKTGSVGPAHPMTETRIADDGEILVRGPQIMKGYYKDEKATREVFTEDGFFMTGDIGHMDEDGYLYITDRKKDLIITAGGKNVAPQVIEGMILLNQFIDQVSLIGDRRKFVTALIVPNFDALKKWAQQNGVEAKDNAALVANEKIIKHFDSIIAEMNKELGRVEQVKKFTLLSEPFTQEKGEITPTLKIKRKVVQKNYSDLIEMMYRE